MGQLLHFPRPEVRPRVAASLAGDVPLWRATAEVFGPHGPRHVSCVLVRPDAARLDLLGASLGREALEGLPGDPRHPDPRFGPAIPALLGLWVDAPACRGLATVTAEVEGWVVEVALTAGLNGIHSAVWVAHRRGPEGVEAHGRLHALAP